MIKTRGISVRILEILEDEALTTIDILSAILSSGYGASYSKLNQTLESTKTKRKKLSSETINRQRFSNLISKLKRENLISRNNDGWKITRYGKNKLKQIRELGKNKISTSPFYEKKNANNFTLIIFDIPEIYKEKRNWLRWALTNMDFKILQKSVWIGKVVIPNEFLRDLKILKIFNYVHIFSVFKSGTIEEG